MVLCVGFIEVLVIGMLIRWIRVRVRLMVIGVKFCGVCLEVVLRMISRNMLVSIILLISVVCNE